MHTTNLKVLRRGDGFALIGPEDGHGPTAKVLWRGSYTQNNAELNANVSLYKAAPDLLAALIQVQLALAAHRDDQPFVYRGGTLSLEEVKYCIVDPAIDKARGS